MTSKFYKRVVKVNEMSRKSIGNLIRSFAQLRESTPRECRLRIQWKEPNDEDDDNYSPHYTRGIVIVSSTKKDVTEKIAAAVEQKRKDLEFEEEYPALAFF